MTDIIEGPAAVDAARARGNVELGNCDSPSTTTVGSTPQAAGSNREEADDYRGRIVGLNGDWRIVECRASIQWVLQRKVGQRHGAGRWASIGFHRSRETLETAVHRRCGQVAPEGSASLHTLPEWFPSQSAVRG